MDDLADAALFLMHHYHEEDIINVGVGRDIPISELADMIRQVVGFKGQITFDPTKPDGTPRKLLDITKLKALGWAPQIPLREGIASTYDWFREHQDSFRQG